MNPRRAVNSRGAPLKSMIVLLVMASASLGGAQVLQTLVFFNGVNGENPVAALTLGNDGNFYGTTEYGGNGNGIGTVFRVTTNGAFTKLASFNYNAYPDGALVLGNDGNLYGTTEYGGGYGNIFKVTTTGTLTTLVSFNGTNGANPQGAMTVGTDGNLYGTTSIGGSYNYGSVFKVTTSGALATVASFNGTNGGNPGAALTLGNDGNFYGTAESGGADGYGTIFQVMTNGTLAALVSFSGANGANPQGSLTLGNDGNFYGTTYGGGGSGAGTVFKVTTNGTLITLVSFNGTNGGNPQGAMTMGTDGSFYGTTSSGGIYSRGSVFKVTTSGVLATVASFNGTDGGNPEAALTLGNDGNFYGTAESGGPSDVGTLFRLSLPPVITVQPLSQTDYAGMTATFLVSVTNLNPTGYQWQKDGTNVSDGADLSGATSNILTVANISDAIAGSYNVVVSNAFATVTSSNAVLTVDDFPFIGSQPQSQTVGVGSNVTFNATCYGGSPFVFQWYFNSVPMGEPTTGANSTSYTLTNVQASQAGNYSVLAVNGDGSVMSSNALLTVEVFPPVITGLQPSNPRVMVGSNVSFSVVVTGTPPFGYQWQFNSASIPNATNANYSIHAVGATNAGNYSLVVTNSAGSATSSNVWLTVLVPPTLTLQIWAGYPLLNLDGLLSNNFVVQYSTNLAQTNWINLLSLTNLSASPYLFIDPAGATQPVRFYRAYMQ
jgi:uncharacterized repeat protein (TIGR03803 family)